MDSNQAVRHSMTIDQVMTKDVQFVHPNDLMDKVSEMFTYNVFRHIPVVEKDGTVVGIISKSDYYKLQNTFTFFKRKDAEAKDKSIFQSLLVEDVMTRQVAKLHPGDSLRKAVDYFIENHFHALPIVDRDNKLVGILTTYDLLQFAY